MSSSPAYTIYIIIMDTEEYHLLGYDAVQSVELYPTSGTTLRATRHHIPEDDTLQNHRCENLKSYVMDIVHIWDTFNKRRF
jgi:hypothetical protein